MTARPPATPDETGVTPPVQPPPDLIDTIARAMSVADWGEWSDDACDDHNKWTWHGSARSEFDRETCRHVARALLSSSDPAVARALLDHYWQTAPDTALAAGTDAGVLRADGATRHRNPEIDTWSAVYRTRSFHKATAPSWAKEVQQ